MGHQKQLPRSKLELHIEWLKNSCLYTPLEELCKAHSVWLEDVLSPAKTKRVMQARLACYEYLRTMEMSYPEIGRVMMRDHTSVMHAVKQDRRKAAQAFVDQGLEVPSDGAEGTKSPKT